MYRKFYGLKEKPFEITVDPRYFYLSETHKEALANLVYAVQERKGFAVITGEAGTGKTTLVQTLLSRLGSNTRTAFLFNPRLDSNSDFLYSICEDLELAGEKGNKVDYLIRLNHYLMDCYSKKEDVVIIIDEAHTLGPDLLEEVRLLTNLENPSSKLLQVILLGQPELDSILNRLQFRALKQRINVRYRLKALNQKETEEYIKRRLRVAGARSTHLFTPGALRKVYHYSKGVPRLINTVCDNALISGYAGEDGIIDVGIIRDVISDREGKIPGSRRKFFFAAAGIAGVSLVLGVLYYYGPAEIGETVRTIGEKIWQYGKLGLKGIVAVLEQRFAPFLS
jgi:general secretion pathway protein A